MLLKDLARGLGISAAMVSKLKKRGMPIASVEAAEKWRRRHLEFARSKGIKPDRREAGYVSDPLDLATAAAVERVRRLGLLAHDALAGASFEIVAPMLRKAMQAIPATARRHVALSVEVWNALTAAIPECGGGGADDLSDEFMGVFWYQISLGPDLADHQIGTPPQPQVARNAHPEGTGGCA